MNKVQMQVPMEPEKSWAGIRKVVDESIIEYYSKNTHPPTENRRSLFKAMDVCVIFKIPKPPTYEWLKIGKLLSVEIQSRKYFRWKDVDELIESNRKNPVKGGI